MESFDPSTGSGQASLRTGVRESGIFGPRIPSGLHYGKSRSHKESGVNEKRMGKKGKRREGRAIVTNRKPVLPAGVVAST